MNRDEYERNLSMGLAAVLTKEEHRNIMDYLHSLSDEEFFLVTEEMKNGSSEDITEKEMMNAQYEIMKNRECLDTGLDNIPAVFLAEDENAVLLQEIGQSRPANLILLEDESVMTDFWRNGNQTVSGVPSDLFFNGSIPLPDCWIQFSDKDGRSVRFRTVIFPDYQKRLSSAGEDSAAQIGAVLYEIAENAYLIFCIEAIRGHDWLMTEFGFGYKGIPEAVREHISEHMSAAEFCIFSSQLIGIWYGVQIALLHPLVKDMFLNPCTVVDESANRKPSGGKKRKKRPLRYIKKHILNAEELKNRIHGGNHHFQRHALVWYVIGHWRRYADGKKIFVRPYWKGALRDLKNGEIREREIILEETT